MLLVSVRDFPTSSANVILPWDILGGRSDTVRVVDDCCDVETGFTELLEAVEIPGDAIGIVLAAIELVVSEVPCTGEETKK